MHLTNYAINKHSKDFDRDEESGSKRYNHDNEIKRDVEVVLWMFSGMSQLLFFFLPGALQQLTHGSVTMATTLTKSGLTLRYIIALYAQLAGPTNPLIS
jgi:hypothetical protein